MFDRFAVDGMLTAYEALQALTEAGCTAPRTHAGRYLRSRRFFGLRREVGCIVPLYTKYGRRVRVQQYVVTLRRVASYRVVRVVTSFCAGDLGRIGTHVVSSVVIVYMGAGHIDWALCFFGEGGYVKGPGPSIFSFQASIEP